MFKNMKLSVKIGVGFGIILIIAVLLGGIAAFNMNNVKNQSTKLAKEYVPEVQVSNNVQRHTLETMYHIRGYVFTEDKQYLESGMKTMSELKNYIKDAKELAARAKSLTKLKEDINGIEAKVNEYEQLVNEAAAKNAVIENDRKSLDAASAEYMKQCYEYLNNQNTEMKQEINSKIEPAKLEERLWKITLINDVIDLGNAVRMADFKSQALRDNQIAGDAVKSFDEIFKKVEELKAKTAKEVNMKQLETIKTQAANFKAALTGLAENRKASDELRKKRQVIGDEITAAAEEIAKVGIENTSKIADAAAASLSLSSLILIIGLIIAIVLGLLLAFIIIRSITKPINRVVEGLSEGAQQVASASNQLSATSQQLAEGNSEQAASIEETSSTLEEASSMVQQNSENTKQAAQLAGQAKNAADKGNAEMQEMMTSMSEIKKSSDQIAKIIKVIDEIAFQTNILALNAAVEAARAGDAGMGFAVVAEEVRNLAQRSAQAAKDTAAIIESNIELSEKGVNVAKKVGESLAEITLQAKKVNELMDEIAAASQEQSQGISQINKAITQMEKVTQMNASNAEESASASEELSAQAENMKEIVGQLIRLVNGSSFQNSRQNGFTVKAAGTSKPGKALEPGRSFGASGKNYSALKAPNGNFESKREGKKTHIVDPEEVIPLNDDLQDF